MLQDLRVLFMAVRIEVVHLEHQLHHSEQGHHHYSHAQDRPDGLLLLFQPGIFSAALPLPL